MSDDARRRIAQALLGHREEQYQAALHRRGYAAPVRDALQPEDWKFRATPRGNLKDGLTGIRIEAKKRF